MQISQIDTLNIACMPTNYKMNEFEDIICWNDDGAKIYLKNIDELEKHILPKYFKHSNYSSFLRQLNMYNFKSTKANNNLLIFIHPDFRRNSTDFLKIDRRQPHKIVSLQEETYLLTEQLRVLRITQFEKEKQLQSAQIQLKEITSSIQNSIQLYIFQLNYFRQQGVAFLSFLLIMIDKLQNSELKQQLSEMVCFYANERDIMPTIQQELAKLINHDIYQLTPVPFNKN